MGYLFTNAQGLRPEPASRAGWGFLITAAAVYDANAANAVKLLAWVQD